MSVKTVRVRIAVAMSGNGEWAAYGWGDPDGNRSNDQESTDNLSELMGEYSLDVIRYVEADVPVPVLIADQSIEGKVQSDEQGDK
jgi:hypothetical protein